MRLSIHALGFLSLSVLTAGCGDANSGSASGPDEATGGAEGVGTGGAGGASRDAGSKGGGGASGKAGTGGSTPGTGSSTPGSGGSTPGTGGAPGCGGSPTPEAGHADPQQPGTWRDVSPVSVFSSSGAETILVDPARSSDIYVNIDQQGTYRSTDYGLTWSKASTGSGDVNHGRQWYGAIDPNPCRDPATSPTLYVTQGFAAGGIWKSTNWGVDWTNVWSDNIFLEDGVTNVSKDVGGDIHSIEIVDPAGPDHLIASLHGYWGTGNHNGVFETKDGGKTWIDHDKTTFHFVAHADLLFSISPTTWMVSHGITYPGSELYRSTDSGAVWSKVADNMMIGRFTVHVGSTVYASGEGLFKTTDGGVTWAKVPNVTTRKAVEPLFAFHNRLYVTAANDLYDQGAELRWSPTDNDTAWTSIALPTGMWSLKLPGDGSWDIHSGLAEHGVVTSDGTHTVIVTSNHNGGVWRYVEP